MTPPLEPLTFDDVTEVYRREQRSKNITEVRKDFYPAIRSCLERLKRDSEREFAVDQFSAKAKSLSNQFTKFSEKAVQIFEFRMEKILQMALRGAVGNRIDTTKLTEEERELFDKVHLLLKERHGLLLDNDRRARPAGEAEEISVLPTKPDMVVEAEAEEEVFDSPGDQPVPVSSAVPVQPVPSPPAVVEAPRTVPVSIAERPAAPLPIPVPVAADVTPSIEPTPSDYVVLRILEDIPAFAGPDKNYKLQKEDMVTLPPTIAKALIMRKKAVGVQLFEGGLGRT